MFYKYLWKEGEKKREEGRERNRLRALGSEVWAFNTQIPIPQPLYIVAINLSIIQNQVKPQSGKFCKLNQIPYRY